MVESPTMETFVTRMSGANENSRHWDTTRMALHTGSPENKTTIKNAKKKKGVRGFI